MIKVGLPAWPSRAIAPQPLKPRFGANQSTDSLSPGASDNDDKSKQTPCRALMVYDPTLLLAPTITNALKAALQQPHPFIRRGRLAAALEQAERLGEWHYLKTQVTLAVADNLLNNPYHPNEKADETEHRLKRALTLYRSIKSQCLKTPRNGLNDTTRPLTTTVMLRMGDTLYGLGELDEAQEHYKGVLGVNPSWKRAQGSKTPLSTEVGEAYLGLSKIAKQDTRLEEALEYSEKSVAIFRQHPLSWNRVRALRHFQDILHVLGDNKQAELLDIEIKQARSHLNAASKR